MNSVRIPVHKGELGTFGYSSKKSVRARRKSIREASKVYGALSMSRKLNVLSIYNKNKNPRLSKKFKEDSEYAERLSKRMYKNSTKAN